MFNDIRSLKQRLAAASQYPDLVVHDRENTSVGMSVPDLEQGLTQFEVEFGVLRRKRAGQRLSRNPFRTG
jgi:hypothetical protein